MQHMIGKKRSGRKKLPKIPKGLRKAYNKKKSAEEHQKKVNARYAEINKMKKYLGRI